MVGDGFLLALKIGGGGGCVCGKKGGVGFKKKQITARVGCLRT